MEKKKAVLILSSGGARGLTQIGVIEEIEKAGFEITAIAGSSIGSLIGGFYAAGKLDAYHEWVGKLDRIDIMRYFDVAFNSRGFIRGDKIMKEMEKVMGGDRKIEDLPIKFKAYSSDIIQHKPVVFEKGSLIDAIRASISIPGIFTPYKHEESLLVDGAISTPMPMEAFDLADDEVMIAVNLNASISYNVPDSVDQSTKEKEHLEKIFHQWREKSRKLFNVKKSKSTKSPGMYGILLRSFEMMQESYTNQLVKTFKPDYYVELSRECADTFEFNKAKELVEYGKQQTIKALNK